MNWHVARHHPTDGDLDDQGQPVVVDPTNVNTTRVQGLGLVPGPPNSTQVTIHAEEGTLFERYFGARDVTSSRATFFRLNNLSNNSSLCELAWTTYPSTPIPAPPAFPW
jgi:hypothetical protein